MLFLIAKIKGMENSNTHQQNKPSVQNAVLKDLKNEYKKVISLNTKNSFIERFYGLKKFFILFLLPLVIAWSVCTESAFLYSNFIETFNNRNWAFFFTILLDVIIEGGKYKIGTLFITGLLLGWFSGTASHQFGGFLLAVLFVLLYGGSAYMSIKGAPMAASHFTKETSPIELEDENLLIARFDKLIAVENATKADALQNKWKGNTTRKGMKLAQTTQENINALSIQREKELKELRARNKALQLEYNSQIDNRGEWFQNFAGCGEIIQIISLLFLGIYYKVSFDEQNDPDLLDDRMNYSGSNGQQLKITSTDPYINQLIQELKINQNGHYPNKSGRKPIGFRDYNDHENRESESTESLETRGVQPERDLNVHTYDVTKLIQNIRNHYRRGKMDLYYKEKQQLEALGWKVLEVSKTSLSLIPPG